MWLPADGRRWQAHGIDDPTDEHDPPAVAFYCPTCAEREFGYRPRTHVVARGGVPEAALPLAHDVRSA